MPKRSSTDLNTIAASIVSQATQADSPPAKNPAAVALGRLGGGLKGGKARANALSAAQRKDIARKAAQKRWRKSD